jgi:hypothetical protein
MLSRKIATGARPLLLAAALAATAASGMTHAAGPASTDEAKASYDRGTTAYRRGDYALAASEYARADELMPNDVALQAALESAVLSDDVPLGMQLLDRSRRAPVAGTLAKAVDSARHKFAGRAGRLRLLCGPSPCTATLDSQPFAIRSAPWVVAGQHRITFTVDGQTEERNIEVRPDELVEARPAGAPAAPSAAPATSASAPPVVVWPVAPQGSSQAPPPRKGPSTWWFWGTVIATGVMGTIAVTTAQSAKSTHDDFESKSCKTTASQECQDLADKGKGNQSGANLTGVLAGLGIVASAVLGIWVVRWDSKTQPAKAAVAVSPTGATLRVSF